MCNGACIMCPREKMRRPLGVMNMGLYRKIIDEAVSLGAKTASIENYGESFLDHNIIDKARYAREKGLKTLTITNGSLLDENMRLKALLWFDTIRISMYAMTKSTYESIHRGLDFDVVTKNIDRLVAVRNVNKLNTQIHMYFLLMSENQNELRQWLGKYENLADAVSAWKPHNWGDGRYYRLVTPDKRTCNRPAIGPLQVQWDGKVVPCCFDYDSQTILGDLNTQTIEEVLKSDKYNDLRRTHKEGDFHKYPFCDGCDQLNKRDDVLVYTNIKEAKVGATNTTFFNLSKNGIYKLGIGTVWFGRRYPSDDSAYVQPEIHEVLSHLDKAFYSIDRDGKMLMIDTAASYGYSEQRLGVFLQNAVRNRLIVATKWGEEFDTATEKSKVDHSLENLEKSVDRSLRRLGKIDILYIHRTTISVLEDWDVIGKMTEMRNSGYGGIKMIGVSISYKDARVLDEALKQGLLGWCDIIQFSVNMFLKRPDLVKKLKDYGIKIVLNSPIRWNRDRAPSEVYAEILKHDGIYAILTGTRHHLKETFGYYENPSLRTKGLVV